MNQASVTLILKLLNMATKYGLPAVKSAIEAMNKEVITEEDIDNLIIEKDPEDFFQQDTRDDG